MLTGPAPELVQGCCSYGAHLVNKKDARRVEKAAATLTPEEWQNHGTKKSVIHENKSGETVTRLVDDACIFLNKPDFPGGVGCAFHIAAMNRGVDHMTLKPEVCWQLPLRREDAVDDDEGHVTSVIRQWDRRHWGKGGREFHWWCTESPEAFVGTKPVYREMQPELTKMVGPEGLRPLRGIGRGARPPADEGRGTPPSGRAEPGATAPPGHRLVASALQRVQSFSGSSSATALVGMEPRMRSYLSSSARHQDAWTSSGSAPHSAHRPVDSVDDRFRLRASSKRRWRPFFTRTPCHTRTACWRPPPYGRTVRASRPPSPL